MTPATAAAVERAYEVFAGYGLPPLMSFCTMCDTAEEVARLHRPLRSLTPDEVRTYAWDAIHHTGDETDFKHFAPRVLEEVAEGRSDFVSIWLSRFPMAGWTEWPAEERAAVLDVLHALWAEELAAFPGPYDVDELLAGVVEVTGDARPFLDVWDACEARGEEAARRHREAFASGGFDPRDFEDGPRAQVVAWLERGGAA